MIATVLKGVSWRSPVTSVMGKYERNRKKDGQTDRDTEKERHLTIAFSP